MLQPTTSFDKMELQKAKSIAVEICYKLQPYCKKINIAGSVRRQKPEVHDIEIICLPLSEDITDLFGEKRGETRAPGFAQMLKSLGKIVKGNAAGKMMQIELPEGIMLDVFIPDDFDYFRQYVVRTGPREYSQNVIAAGWVKKGWCGSDEGLRKKEDCLLKISPEGEGRWICTNPIAEKPPAWDSEQSFFNWIGQPMVHPSKRN